MEFLKKRLLTVSFINNHKFNLQDFTRGRKLSFASVFTLILRKSTKSIQLFLNESISDLGDSDSVTASAFSQARNKLKHTAFAALNKAIINFFYSHAELKLWKGYRLLGVDGSRVILPDTKDVKLDYGSTKIKNQSNKELGEYNSGLCLCAYDLLNNMAVDSSLGRSEDSEFKLFYKLLKDGFNKRDIFIFDRGFNGYEIMAKIMSKGMNFIIRCHSKSFKEVQEMLALEGSNSLIKKVTINMPINKKKSLFAKKLPKQLKLKLVRIILPTGEPEVLITSIMDDSVSADDFKKLYGMRWGVETFFSKIKNRLSLENFTGKSAESVRQDFWATIMISNLETIMTYDLEEEINKTSAKHKKKINKAVSFNVIKNHAFDILINQGTDIDVLVEKMEKLFITNPVIVKPDRQNNREKPPPRKVANYHKRKKKTVF